ncbi:hypothetical protein [Aeribacillus composti]|uniref:hypothetical protein n=1 Tax=Aeribacillus composti TaxID=1868734 RepID=UPI002E220AFA|nr:hypothetical protein [Aeribacillus composti]
MNQFKVFADVKTTVSIKVQADNQQEAEMIAQRQLNDLSVANVKLQIENLNGEVFKPNVADFSFETITVEEE